MSSDLLLVATQKGPTLPTSFLNSSAPISLDLTSSFNYVNGLWIVGESNLGKLYTSSDGVNFSEVSTGMPVPTSPQLLTITSIRFLNGVYFATAYFTNYPTTSMDGYIIRSTDGSSWSVVLHSHLSGGNDSDIRDIAFGSGIFIAPGEGEVSGVFNKSSDGINWTQSNINPRLKKIIYANGKFVGLSRESSDVVTSVSGETPVTTSTISGTTYDIAYDAKNGVYVIAGQDNNNYPTIFYSYDLVSWSSIVISSMYGYTSTGFFNSISAEDGVYGAAGVVTFASPFPITTPFSMAMFSFDVTSWNAPFTVLGSGTISNAFIARDENFKWRFLTNSNVSGQNETILNY